MPTQVCSVSKVIYYSYVRKSSQNKEVMLHCCKAYSKIHIKGIEAIGTYARINISIWLEPKLNKGKNTWPKDSISPEVYPTVEITQLRWKRQLAFFAMSCLWLLTISIKNWGDWHSMHRNGKGVSLKTQKNEALSNKRCSMRVRCAHLCLLEGSGMPILW